MLEQRAGLARGRLRRGDEDEDDVRREDAATLQEVRERAPRDRRGNAQPAAPPALSCLGRVSKLRVSLSRLTGDEPRS